MSRLAGGAHKLVGVSDDKMERMARWVIDNDGQIARGAAHAGHSDIYAPLDPENQMVQAFDTASKRSVGRNGKKSAHPLYGTGQYRWFTPIEGQFTDHWVSGLQKRSQELPAQRIARDILDSHAAGVDITHPDTFTVLLKKEAARVRDANEYGYERDKMMRHDEQSPEEFASARVDDLLNYVIGKDDTVHQHLLEKLADGVKPTHADVKDIKLDASPERLTGEELAPSVAGNILGDLMQRGFQRIVDPIANYISREPIMWHTFNDEYEKVLPLVAKGVLTDDHAWVLAKQRASVAVVDKIQIPQVRSQMAMIAGNLMPFYYAQEQAIKRAVKLVKRDPSALAKYAWTNYAMTNPAWIHTDDNGNRYMMIPGSEMLGGAWLKGMSAVLPTGAIESGIPLAYNGTIESFKNAMPYSALMNDSSGFGIGPVASVPLNFIANIDPVFGKIVKPVLGDFSYQQSLLNSLVPNTSLRSAITAMRGDERDRAFANAMFDAISAAQYHGLMPGPDASAIERQNFLDKIKNDARSAFFLKAALSFVSPVGASPVMADIGKDGKTFRQEFLDLAQKKGNYLDALQEWMATKGGKAVGYTVAHSDNPLGVSVPGTSKTAIDWIENNQSLLGQYGGAGAFLIPQVEDAKGDYNLIHHELLRLQLKHMDSPQEFYEQVLYQGGNRGYFDKRDERDKLLAQYAGDKAATENIKANWSAWSEQYTQLNPVWADKFYTQSRTNNAKTMVGNLVQMFTDGAAPQGQQTSLVKQLLQNYLQQQASLAQLGNQSMYDAQRKQIQQNWSAYLDHLKKTQPLLQDALNSIFVPLENLNA
jgi:hypothetical protein